VKEKSPKTPSLTVVGEGPENGLKPPRKLGPAGGSLWARIQSEYAITDVGGVELLCLACQALDRAEALADAIARDGEVIHSRTGIPKTHPAVKDELACRSFVAKTLQKLGVTDEPLKAVGRPARSFGWRGPHAD
jgi:hypothetical protein